MNLSQQAKRRLSQILPPALALFLALGAALAVPQSAFAHAKPTSSTPSPNQNLTTAPTTVTIIFGQHVKPEGSDIIVYDKDGKKVNVAYNAETLEKVDNPEAGEN